LFRLEDETIMFAGLINFSSTESHGQKRDE